jgi:carboxyl-terminal processing protease
MSCNLSRRFGSLWLVLALLTIIGSGLSAAEQKEPKVAPDADYELMRAFADTFDQVRKNYVKEVDDRTLIEAAIRGMITELDQYSDYIDRDDLARFTQQVEQEFGGIGIQVQIDPKTRRLIVMTPPPVTPAYRSGVRAGDLIMTIEGKTTEGVTLSGAVKLLKGKAGTKVTIGVRHEDAEKIEDIAIERAIIKVPTVLGDTYNKDSSWDYMCDDQKGIGYIRLTHFSRRSAAELQDVLQKLTEAGMKGLILDLRFNPGGLLSQAVKISDMFIKKGKIVSTEGRNSKPRQWYATQTNTFGDFPMAVLVNHYSASASEIVSACLQDYDRAIVIGERTWGKGSVQNVIELEQGKSALKLTTASYHRPSGKNIHRFEGAKETDEWGVSPDEGYEVKLSKEEMRAYLDYRRKRDVIGKEDGDTESPDRQRQKAMEYILSELNPDSEPKPDVKPAPETEEAKVTASKPEAKKRSVKNAASEKPSKDQGAFFFPPQNVIPTTLAG